MFGENVSEMLEYELVYVRNHIDYMTRYIGMKLRCTDKIMLAIHCETLALIYRVNLKKHFKHFEINKNMLYNFMLDVISYHKKDKCLVVICI
jgi:hypothetical protein